ncbi:MAG: hypothetical protein MH204_09225, partial [Fimbriimonadaceae bacterium]|nr:hypothetical protein [Fimbriimonadaceae bacterium]
QRARYVEARLKGGLPAVAVSLPGGVLIAALRGPIRKVFEVYDRIGMVGMGVQTDFEALRVAAVEYCHKEGYQRSPEDVTLERLSYGLGTSIKKAFSDLRQTPLVARALLAEAGDTPEGDSFTLLDYDGDFTSSKTGLVLTGRPEDEEPLRRSIQDMPADPEEAAQAVGAALRAAYVGETPVHLEAGFIRRSEPGDRKFRLLAKPAEPLQG